jgi:hypothetical protein
VFWPAGDVELRVAVVVIQGQSNPRRERAALEGWQASIAAARYAQLRCLAHPATARHLGRLAVEIGLTAPQFIAGECVMADEPPVLPSIIENADEASESAETGLTAAPSPPRSSSAGDVSPHQRWDAPDETPKRSAEHQKLINEVLGHGEPTRRRRWPRGAA